MASAVECYLQLHPELAASVSARSDLNKRRDVVVDRRGAAAASAVEEQAVDADAAAGQRPAKRAQQQRVSGRKRTSRAAWGDEDRPPRGAGPKHSLAFDGGGQWEGTPQPEGDMEGLDVGAASGRQVASKKHSVAALAGVGPPSRADSHLTVASNQSGSPASSNAPVAVPIRSRKQKTVQRSAMH